MTLKCCRKHKRIFICGRWCSTEDYDIKRQLFLHANEIRWDHVKCDKCFSEAIPP